MERSFLGKLIVSEILKNFPTFYAHRRFITMFAEAHCFFPVPRHVMQAMIFRPSFKLPATPRHSTSSKCSTKILRVFLISPTHFRSHAHLLISADHAAAPWSASGAVGSLAVLAAMLCCEWTCEVTDRGQIVCCACSDLRNIQFATSAMCFRYYKFYFS